MSNGLKHVASPRVHANNHYLQRARPLAFTCITMLATYYRHIRPQARQYQASIALLQFSYFSYHSVHAQTVGLARFMVLTWYIIPPSIPYPYDMFAMCIIQ